MTACQAEERGRPRPIEMLVTTDPETLDPRYVTDAVGMRVTRLVHAGLTRTDPETLRPVPYLAQSLVWHDALSLDVTLRPDIQFHGGSPFTAGDVVATLAAFGSEAVASRHAGTVEPIASAEALSPLRVRIHLKRPHASLAADLDLPILRHDQAASPPDPSGSSLDGLGPFELEPGGRGELSLRPAHGGVRTGEEAARDRVTIRTIHDENARTLRLFAGRADIAPNGVSPTLLSAVDGREGLTVVSTPGANLTYLVMRVDRPPLAELGLRRAISLAIDRDAITRDLFLGHASRADSLFPDGHWARPTAPPRLVRDADEARRLVDLGPARHLTLLTSTDRLRVSIARTVAQELGDVGLDVEIVPLELGSLLARLDAGDFDLASLQLPELTEPNILRVFFDSRSIPPRGANRGRVRDAALDALFAEGDATTNETDRAAVYARIDERIRDQLFVIPLWHEDQVAVVSRRARAFRPSPDGRWLSLASLR